MDYNVTQQHYATYNKVNCHYIFLHHVTQTIHLNAEPSPLARILN